MRGCLAAGVIKTNPSDTLGEGHIRISRRGRHIRTNGRKYLGNPFTEEEIKSKINSHILKMDIDIEHYCVGRCLNRMLQRVGDKQKHARAHQ